MPLAWQANSSQPALVCIYKQTGFGAIPRNVLKPTPVMKNAGDEKILWACVQSDEYSFIYYNVLGNTRKLNDSKYA
jgi:hypothetical protein